MSGREVDQSLPSSALVMNEWSSTCIPLVRLHGVDWDNFTILNLFFFSNLTDEVVKPIPIQKCGNSETINNLKCFVRLLGVG